MATELWELACHVLNEAGRARVHKLRNSLNAVALGIELLDDGGPQPAGPPSRGIDGIRQQIAEAAIDIEGLDALVDETTHPGLTLLPDAIGWSVDVARPVAERRNVSLLVPYPLTALPPHDVPKGFSVALGEFLVAACLTSDRGQRCIVEARTASPVCLTIRWRPGPLHDEPWFEAACAVMRSLLSPHASCQLEASDDTRLLIVRFA